MKPIQTMLAVVLLVQSLALTARADFQYTETSQVTGGALVGMMKFAGVFARGDVKKQEQQAMQPTSTTHYVKGGHLRTDNADGTSQIIDLEGKRVISINNTNKTYAVATFDQIRDAMQKAMQNVQAQQDAQAKQNPEAQNAQLNITPTVKVTPGTGNRMILGQSTNETKFEMDITMQATGPNAPPPGQPNSVTMTTNMDTFVAPSVSGYEEFGEFYRRMAKEVNWMTLPPNIHVADPRVSQSDAGGPGEWIRLCDAGGTNAKRTAAIANEFEHFDFVERQYSHVDFGSAGERSGWPVRQKEGTAAAKCRKHRSK